MKYMKKISLSLAVILMLGTGCGGANTEATAKSQETAVEEELSSEELSEEDILKILEELAGVNMLDDEVVLPDIGIEFTVPDELKMAENINLLPDYQVEIDNPIYAYLEYAYAPDENMPEIEDPESEVSIYELSAPAFTFFVVKEENLEEPIVVNSLKLYDTVKELLSDAGYHIYFMTDFNQDTSFFSEEAQAKYEEVVALSHQVLGTTIASIPDEAGVRARLEANRQGLVFSTETLDGEAIDSSIFEEYNLTMVQFWGSYTYPGINEFDNLEHMYFELTTQYPDVNFFQIIIDTPDAEVEELVKSLYEENDVNFKGVKADQTIAAWAMQNLEGVPTTIFVDGTGRVLSTQLEGTQDIDYYLDKVLEVLSELRL